MRQHRRRRDDPGRRHCLRGRGHIRQREFAQALPELFAGAPAHRIEPRAHRFVVGRDVVLARRGQHESQHVLQIRIAEIAIAVGHESAHRQAHPP